jgi:DNA-binding MurR/RpiR family transcriptional regulator
MGRLASSLPPPPPPKDFDDLRDALVERRVKLPKRLEQVARFAIAHPEEIAFGTVASIAEKAEVQPSALVRFAQALGYPGFSDLQRTVFQGRLREKVTSYDERLAALRVSTGPSNRTAALFGGFCTAATASIERLRESLDLDTLEEAARVLARAETIYLIAQRRSYPVTAYMSYAFAKLGVKTVLIGSGLGTDPETIGFAGPRDAAIAISFTPYAATTIALARAAADRGAKMVVVTDSPFSPLIADSAIWFEVVEADFRGFRSLAAAMSLAMTLTVAVADLRRSEPQHDEK